MDIRKLETFVDLAQTLSYTESAAHLYVTQATVSKHIKALEQELDVVLFDRTHRQVTLTAAGAFALPYAQKIVGVASAWQQAQAAKQKAAAMTLVLRAVPSIVQYDAFNTIAAFTKAHPEVDLQFSEAETDRLLPALDDGSVDVVYTRVFGLQGAGYDVLANEADRFVALVPKDHPLAQRKTLEIQALADQSLLLLSQSTGLYQPAIELLQAAGIHPKISYTGKRIDLIAGMVNRGMGVALAMAGAVDLAAYPNIVALRFEPAVLSRMAFMRKHGRHSPASDLFWAFSQAQQK